METEKEPAMIVIRSPETSALGFALALVDLDTLGPEKTLLWAQSHGAKARAQGVVVLLALGTIQSISSDIVFEYFDGMAADTSTEEALQKMSSHELFARKQHLPLPQERMPTSPTHGAIAIANVREGRCTYGILTGVSLREADEEEPSPRHETITAERPVSGITWSSSDPRIELVDLKRAHLIILRPHPNGRERWEAGTGWAEMKHSWLVETSFENHPVVGDEWPEDWVWTLAPESVPTIGVTDIRDGK